MGDLGQAAIDMSVPGRKGRKERKMKKAKKRAAKAEAERKEQELAGLLPDEDKLRRNARVLAAKRSMRGRAGTILSRDY